MITSEIISFLLCPIELFSFYLDYISVKLNLIQLYLVWFLCLVFFVEWHINIRGLFNAKSIILKGEP